MDTDEEMVMAGLIKAELWLTPMQARVVRAVVDAMRQHAVEGHMHGEMEIIERVISPPSRVTKPRRSD